jgi:hypothetical protein
VGFQRQERNRYLSTDQPPHPQLEHSHTCPPHEADTRDIYRVREGVLTRTGHVGEVSTYGGAYLRGKFQLAKNPVACYCI